MKKSLFILFLAIVLSSNYLLAQNRPPQDVRRVIVTSKYEIKNGQRTSKSMAVKQEIKDSLDRVHTILNRDYTTQQVISHTWHTFNGKQIVRTDEFANEKLKYYKLFTYNADSTIATESIYMVNPTDTALYIKLTYKYNNFRKPIQINATDLKGKKAFQTKSVYNAKGTEVKRTVKLKKNYVPLDSVISLVNVPVYDSVGRISAEVITRKFSNGKTLTESFRYGYDKAGLLSSVETLDGTGKTLTKKTLEYNNKGMLKFISVFDANNTLTEYYANRYELYPTRDRRNQIIEY
ncbi:hypothetical protein CYCD_08640 [Tenuifilaceae bacterium CYCD]|nr:hypothetical protein CYCD_08640 [Tenuifilaceae bacterium CYCD]